MQRKCIQAEIIKKKEKKEGKKGRKEKENSQMQPEKKKNPLYTHKGREAGETKDMILDLVKTS